MALVERAAGSGGQPHREINKVRPRGGARQVPVKKANSFMMPTTRRAAGRGDPPLLQVCDLSAAHQVGHAVGGKYLADLLHYGTRRA
ncbi:hypothetical protein MED01_006091 [Micromonospora sp. MED01]|nr:hypothetical protein [Micromonospora alfalfae]